LQQENRKLKNIILEKTTQSSEDLPMIKATPAAVKFKCKIKVIKEVLKKAEIAAVKVTRSSSQRMKGNPTS